MSLEKIIKQVNTHFYQYTDEEIERIIQAVSVDDEHIVTLDPEVNLADDPHNLRFTRDKSYRQFVKKMQKHGLFVHTNIDAFKVKKLFTLNRVQKASQSMMKKARHVPNLEEITFSTYRFSSRIGSRILDSAFYYFYLRYY